MRKLVFLFIVSLSVISIKSQELNCIVTVNSEQISGSNKQVFSTLQKSLKEYINQTEWTNREVKPIERIQCAMNIIISSRDNNNFEASIQVQSTRPVHGSTYTTPILNLKDNAFSFKYNEFDPLVFNKNSFDNNLISTIVFYVQIILGADADTFKKYGGETNYREAQNIMLQAQQSGLAAWQNNVGKQNRYSLIDDLLSSKLKNFRNTMYDYHRNGLDNFAADERGAKQRIEDSILSLETIFNKSVGNNLLRVFFDAKSDEIVSIFSDGSKTRNADRLAQTLRKISANNNRKWGKIK